MYVSCWSQELIRGCLFAHGLWRHLTYLGFDQLHYLSHWAIMAPAREITHKFFCHIGNSWNPPTKFPCTNKVEDHCSFVHKNSFQYKNQATISENKSLRLHWDGNCWSLPSTSSLDWLFPLLSFEQMLAFWPNWSFQAALNILFFGCVKQWIHH